MYILTKAEIQKKFDFSLAVSQIKNAFVSSSNGGANIALVGHIPFPNENGDCHIKSGHILGEPFFVIKIATGFYDNPKIGKSSSNGVMVAFDSSNGEPIALLQDEGWLTDMRTGIGGAIATEVLAPKSAKNVLVIGTGIQSRFQIECLQKITDVDYTFHVWGRSEKKAAELCDELSKKDIAVGYVLNIERAVGDADIIITTTQAMKFIVKDDWVSKATHITAVGADSPGKEELELSLIERANCLVSDLASQSLEHGEFQRLKMAGLKIRPVELGDILDRKALGRKKEEDITIADLTGLATQDIAIAGTILLGDKHKGNNNAKS